MHHKESLPEPVQPMLGGPYWRVIVRPTDYQAEYVSFAQLESTLQKAQVRLRGWYFPHLSRRANEICSGTNYLAMWNIFHNYEYWRFYESAQLIHYHGVRECVDSGYKEKIEEVTRSNLKWLDPDWSTVTGYFDIINFVYTVTEIFEFAARLASALELQKQMHIEIGLENVKGFILGISDWGRAWDYLYQWNGSDSLSGSWDVDSRDLSATAHDQSLAAIIWFFQRFGWKEANYQALRDAQIALFNRQF